ncbi:MAG: hypothetical protein Q9190_004976 [Brigantiaea leucoxantha]
MDHPKKRRRRRRAERAPIAANLIFDQQLKGNIALLSAELFGHVFPHTFPQYESHDDAELQYAAVSPWSWLSSEPAPSQTWVVLPVRLQKPENKDKSRLLESSLRLPVSYLDSPAITEILEVDRTLSATAESKAIRKVGILDVEPVTLDAVFVAVDGDALDKHEEVQRQFAGGFDPLRSSGHTNKGKGKSKTYRNQDAHEMSEQDRRREGEKELKSAVRQALAASLIVRQGNFLRLPLAAHPITHVPFPLAEITLCEPVHQGLMSSQTKVVVKRIDRSNKKSHQSIGIFSAIGYTDGIREGEETSNEQFYSAAEDGPNGSAPEYFQDSPGKESDSSEAGKGSESESDDSDNVISLSAPALPSKLSGVHSLTTVATPRIGGSLRNGTSTPGSVFSNYTASTARQGLFNGRIFDAQGLLEKVSDDLLYPQPSKDEDDEARVFIDVKLLVKIGCFSGDWIKVEAVSKGDRQQHHWGVDEFNDDAVAPVHVRIVKVYGLPSVASSVTLKYPKNSTAAQTSSHVAITKFNRPKPLVWMSPILLANIGHPSQVRLASLTTSVGGTRPFSPAGDKHRTGYLSMPPLASEVTLLKISTPISQEAALQSGIFATLKTYFESRRRVVHSGDLIALTLDPDVCRLFGPTSSAIEKDSEGEELALITQEGSLHNGTVPAVVWFKVDQVVTSATAEQEVHKSSPWGGAALVEPKNTRMPLGASVQQKLPPSTESKWQYYLGLRHTRILPQNSKRPYRAIAIPQGLSISILQQRLRELIAAATSPQAVYLSLDPVVILLHSSQRSIGKSTVSSRAASDVGIHSFLIDCNDLQSEGNARDIQESSLTAKITRALSCGPHYTSILVRNVESLVSDQIISAFRNAAKECRVLIATTTKIDQVSEDLRSLFTHEIEMSAPDEAERENILQDIVANRGVRVARDVDMAAIAVKTAALVAGNLVDIVDRAVIARQDRHVRFMATSTNFEKRHSQLLLRDLLVSGGEWSCCVMKADFDLAVEAARKNFADAIGAPKIPNVGWDDVGGLENVKDAVMETIQLPLERPELFAKGMKKRSGILFYGPPGTGKTLLAKAIATEFSLNFFSVKGPELLNMYIGESEANVRRVFQRARDARPCVVFFDELDSVAPKRGNQGDSGGVMDRIVSQLLAELDGMSRGEEGGSGVFVIGATNRPDLLDQALLRPGRFDKMLYLGVSDTHQKQLRILEALTRKFALDSQLSLERVADSLPFTYTGADLYALCSDAMLKAITRQASAVDAKIKALPGEPVSTAYFFDHLATEQDMSVAVTEEDFKAAKRELVGSVSAKELEHYQRVRHTFEAPAKPPSASTENIVPPVRSVQQSVPLRPKYSSRSSTTVKHTATSRQDMKGKGKGKGKAVQRDSDSDNDDEDEDAYVTSNDFESPPFSAQTNGFSDPATNDEEEVYG